MIQQSHIVTSNPVNNVRVVGFPRFNVFSAFPTTLRATLPYVESLGINSNSVQGSLGTAYTFVPNSLFAPNAGGHQPYTFDQLCSATGPYTKYKVLGYKCRITATNFGGTTFPLHVVTRLVNITDNYSLSSQPLNTALEKPGSRMDIISPQGQMQKSWEVSIPDLSVMFNWSKEMYTADTSNSMGNYGSSPSSLIGLHFAVSNNWSTGVTNLNFVFEFQFDAVFTERQTLASS